MQQQQQQAPRAAGQAMSQQAMSQQAAAQAMLSCLAPSTGPLLSVRADLPSSDAVRCLPCLLK